MVAPVHPDTARKTVVNIMNSSTTVTRHPSSTSSPTMYTSPQCCTYPLSSTCPLCWPLSRICTLYRTCHVGCVSSLGCICPLGCRYPFGCICLIGGICPLGSIEFPGPYHYVLCTVWLSPVYALTEVARMLGGTEHSTGVGWGESMKQRRQPGISCWKYWTAFFFFFFLFAQLYATEVSLCRKMTAVGYAS